MTGSALDDEERFSFFPADGSNAVPGRTRDAVTLTDRRLLGTMSLRQHFLLKEIDMIRHGIRLLMLLAVLALAGPALAGNPAAPLSTPELSKMIGGGKKNTIVFFLNPLGGPCAAQKRILEQLQKDRGNNFNIAFVSTMKQEDTRAFYDYGVRSLPTVVLVDRKGLVNRYFPPGIQSYETLAAALDGAK